jgi:hypothetical protein
MKRADPQVQPEDIGNTFQLRFFLQLSQFQNTRIFNRKGEKGWGK